MKVKDFIKIVGWDVINPISLKRKKNRQYDFQTEKYNGINIGCGINNPKNWLGVDGGFTHQLIHKLPKPVYKRFFSSQRMASNYSFEEYYALSKGINLIHHELKYGLPFKDESIPNIFTSHFLEHITHDECKALLKECYRVIKPNGIIRICVPSLEEAVASMETAIKNYRLNNEDEIQEYVTFDISGFNSSYSNHRYMYDFERMHKVLKNAGFKQIKEFKEKEGNIPDVEILDTRGGLIVEATK